MSPGSTPRERRYWSLDLSKSESPDARPTLQASVTRLRETLGSVVAMELTAADVPVGVSLSGGIDSSALVAFSRNVLDHPVKTFCFQFDEKTHDESPDAELVARHCGAEHHNFRRNHRHCRQEPQIQPALILPRQMIRSEAMTLRLSYRCRTRLGIHPIAVFGVHELTHNQWFSAPRCRCNAHKYSGLGREAT